MKLPSPPRLYDPLYEAQRNRILESFAKQTYIKGQDVGIYNPAKLIVPSVDSLEGAVVNKLGVFCDTTTQTPTAIYTPQAITFNTTDASDGFSRGSPTSRIIADRKEWYNFQFSAQISSGSSSGKKIWFLVAHQRCRRCQFRRRSDNFRGEHDVGPGLELRSQP